MVVKVLDAEPTDPVIELRGYGRQSLRWYSEQRVDLVPSQLKPELEAGAGRVPKEIAPETVVR